MLKKFLFKINKRPYLPTSITCYGDSITAQNKYTNGLSKLGWNVENFGVSGSGYSDIGDNESIKSRIVSTNAKGDVIFILGGTNDWGSLIPLGKYDDTNNETFCGCLYQCFKAVRGKYPNKPIYVSTILQRDWTPSKEYPQPSGMLDNGNGDSVIDFNNAIKYMASLHGIRVIDGFSCGITKENLEIYAPDGVHISDKGGMFLAEYISNIILSQSTSWKY